MSKEVIEEPLNTLIGNVLVQLSQSRHILKTEPTGPSKRNQWVRGDRSAISGLRLGS